MCLGPPPVGPGWSRRRGRTGAHEPGLSLLEDLRGAGAPGIPIGGPAQPVLMVLQPNSPSAPRTAARWHGSGVQLRRAQVAIRSAARTLRDLIPATYKEAVAQFRYERCR
jgi:hypothetical protein